MSKEGHSLAVGFAPPGPFPAKFRIADSIYFGMMNFVEDERIIVTLVSSEDLPDRIPEVSFVSSEAKGKLFKLLRNGRQTFSNSDFGTVTYACFYGVFAAALSSAEPPSTTRVVQLRFDQLREWNTSQIIRKAYLGNSLTITTSGEVSERYSMGKAQLVFHAAALTTDSLTEVDVKQDNFLELTLEEHTSIAELGSALRSIQHLCDFVFGNPVHFGTIDAIDSDPDPSLNQTKDRCSLFLPLRKRGGHSELVENMNWIVVREMKNKFEHIVTSWDRLWSRFADPIAVLYNSYYGDTFIDTKFMNAVAFLDSYGIVFRSDKRRLKARLLDFLTEYKDEFGPFLKTPLAELAVRMSKTRNALAHLDARYSDFVDQSLGSLAACVFLLSECVIASELGISGKVRSDIVSSRIQRTRFDI
jgi:hypothetical protein